MCGYFIFVLFQHITVQRRGKDPQPQRCHEDANLFTCPFCSSDTYKPCQYHQIMTHIAGHKLRSVEHGGKCVSTASKMSIKDVSKRVKGLKRVLTIIFFNLHFRLCYIQLWPWLWSKGQTFSLLSVSTDLHK